MYNSRLGIGTWQNFYFENLSELDGLINYAHEQNIRYFDTSDNYFDGDSEKILGLLLQKFPRDSYKVSTKCFHPNSHSQIGGLSALHVRRSLNQSLKNINTDYIDILFAHRFDENQSIEQIATTFNQLIEEKKILNWGICKWPLDKAAALMDFCDRSRLKPPVGQQFQFNLLNKDAERLSFPLFHSHNLPTIAYSTLAQGVLSGKYSNAIPINSRASKPFSKETMWDLSPDKIEKVKIWAKKISEKNLIPAHVALEFCLRRQEISTILLGPRNKKQLAEIINSKKFSWHDFLVEDFINEL
jgi:aryl-alcohol dehydrogenase-like predicted oxidoreductase